MDQNLRPRGARSAGESGRTVLGAGAPLKRESRAKTGALPAGIWALGFGSLFMDASSELIHSILPIFMTTVLGASMVTIGLVEGIAEATASITKVFSGILSDRMGKRKWLVVSGYGLGAMAKPVFPLASSVSWVLAARFADRIGKGIRGAPRDALIADIAPAELRGAAYGLRQSLDSVGAFVGPLLAVMLMASMENDIRRVLWVAVVPALISVLLLAASIREPDRHTSTPTRPRFSGVDISRLPRPFWTVVVLGAVFTMARFSEAFLVLRAQSAGLAIGFAPAVMIAMNVTYAAAAYPAGAAADRIGTRTLLIAGVVVLIVADVVLAVAATPAQVFAGAVCWGLHMGLTQGLFAKLVADAAPADARGSAFGVFNIVSGAVQLLASVMAGWLWTAAGPSATFAAGAIFSAITVIGLLVRRQA